MMICDTYEYFIAKWLRIPKVLGTNSMKRVDNSHPLDLFIGYDINTNPLLLLISNYHVPGNIQSSTAIEVDSRIREDKRWAVTFTLREKELDQEFYYLCWDLIQYCRNLSATQDSVNALIERYNKWQRLMMQQGKIRRLSFSELKGLVGELLFLKDYIIPKYGVTIGLQSWVGPEGEDQDFICPDRWYEIKTIDPSRMDVSISSLDQLDQDTPGTLGVLLVSKTVHDSGFTIVELLNDIRVLITGYSQIFNDKLLMFGYIYLNEYDQVFFQHKCTKLFEVSDTFPRLRRFEVSPVIQRACYDISLAGLAPWEIRSEEGC